MSLDSSKFAKSGSNSKRSFNSTNSNNTGGNNCNKKKRKKEGDSGQQTLGMAWGSNSRSSSRSSFRSSPFTDVGSYMAVKNRKLHEQFDAAASSSSHGGSGSKKPVFEGVSIFVDGYTVPSTQELRGYMLKHGGRFENYFSRQRVTHIICSNLPDSKVKNFRSFSRGLPVVKPIWILDSIAANKLLSWVPYQLDQISSEANKQPKLSAFLGLRSNLIPITSDINMSEVSDSAEDVRQPNQGACSLVHDGCNELKVNEPTCSNNEVIADTITLTPLEETQSKCSSPCQPSASESSRCSEIQNVTQSPSIVSGSSNKAHSVSLDPNFVETYFKNSRLHFIGTWRNRYRKKFASSSDRCRPSTSITPSTILHIDMDCFFVSVVIRNRPELWDKPVAVCHSDNPRGTSEISSANYPARDHGVRVGIFVRDAKALCPHLVIIPYNFEAYEEVADQFYSVLHKHCNRVQAMSCDEAILDITNLEVNDFENLASLIRKEIFDTTGCTASAGISGNILMARLATRTAKPNGQCYLPPENVNDFLKELPVKALPGIGRALDDKLKGRHIKTCGELRMMSKESLQKDFGQKTGDMLWNYSRGIDNRLVGMIQESKSVGAEVNWGVRFNDLKDSQNFLVSLCKEVSLRLHGCGVKGRAFTLKVKKRKTDEEPVKYMGCGDCDNLSHTITVPMATDDVDVLQRITKQLFSHFHIDVKDIRGVGLQVTKLESAENFMQGNEKSSIRSWLVSATSKEKESVNIVDTKGQIGNLSNQEANRSLDVPPLSELDSDVLESLPPEILSEINDLYGGKLKEFISNHKCESTGAGTSSIFPRNVEGIPENINASASTSQNTDMMPISLSQIDASVLQELPQEIRNDIIDLLPAHRDPETHGSNPQTDLWVGNPPQWVTKFKSSDYQILRFFSDTYSQLKSTSDLSSVLLKTVASSSIISKCDFDAICWLFELLKQYIDLKLDSDLEEIHTCFRLLKRLSCKSEFFLRLYDITLPHLQTIVGEKYGGSLHI